MRYTVWELVEIKKNVYDDTVWCLDTVWPEQSMFDNKEDAVALIEKLKLVETRIERRFTILEVW